MIKHNGMNLDDIKNIIPHRDPFLFVDLVEFININERRLVAYKQIKLQEPHFEGHFPQNPIMPGVLMIEAMAQASIILGKALEPEKGREGLFVFTGIDDAKFEGIVVPDCKIRIECYSPKIRDPLYISECKVFVDDINRLVASAKIKAFRKS